MAVGLRSEIILSNLGGIEHNNLVNIVDIDTKWSAVAQL